MYTKYRVSTESFVEAHYLKKFRKKYKKYFEVPWNANILMLQKLDLMLERNIADVITNKNDEIVICKTEFKIMPNESAKTSGNRCIVAKLSSLREVKILFVYHKSDIRGSRETVWWRGVIKENYPQYKDIL